MCFSFGSTTKMLDFPSGSVLKNPSTDAGDAGSIPGSGRSREEEIATHPSNLAWKIPWTWLKWLSMHACMLTSWFLIKWELVIVSPERVLRVNENTSFKGLSLVSGEEDDWDIKMKVSLGCAMQHFEFSLVLIAHSNSVDLNQCSSYWTRRISLSQIVLCAK